MDDNSKEIDSGGKEAENKTPLSILLVEDDTALVPVIILMLEGHNVTSFESAEKASDELRKANETGNSFDWVITDWRLAGKMDGFGLADLIKRDKLGQPFVTMLTGSAAEIRAKNPADELQKKGIHQLIGKSQVNELRGSVKVVREFKTQFQNPQI